MDVARYDETSGELPFPILRALAYRGGVGQQLDAATCVAANKCLTKCLTEIVDDATTIAEDRRSLTVSWIDVWTAVAKEPTGSLKHLFTGYNAFKKVPTFRVFSEFEHGLSPRTAREIHDMHVDWKANGNQGDFFGVDPKRLEKVIEHTEWELKDHGCEPERKLTEQEKNALLNEIRVELEKARDACAEYANHVPAPASVDLSHDETHETHGSDDDADYDDDDEDADDDDDDDDAAAAAEADIDSHSEISEGASVVHVKHASSDLWAYQMRPALDAKTLPYKHCVAIPRPKWADELASGKIGDEDTSKFNREVGVRIWLFEVSDCLACPIFVVKNIIMNIQKSIPRSCSFTRDAMTLFHFALEYFVVSLFELYDPTPAIRVQIPLAAERTRLRAEASAADAAKERAELLSEASVASAAKEAVLESEVAALKSQNAELVRRAMQEADLVRRAKQDQARMDAVEADLKAQVAVARGEAAVARGEAAVARGEKAQAEAALVMFKSQAASNNLVAAVEDTPVPRLDARPSVCDNRATETPNPACASASSSVIPALTDASEASPTEAPIAGVAPPSLPKRTHPANPTAEAAKRVRLG
jgi:hypothetical protein